MKRLISLMLTIILCFSTSFEVFAIDKVYEKQTINLELLKFAPKRLKPEMPKGREVNLENILFMGNSLVCGIDLITENHDFIAEISLKINNARTRKLFDEIKNFNFEVVVICFGTNELGSFSKEKWQEEFSYLFDKIYEANPTAIIVIMTVPPVSESRSNNGDVFNNENVQICNEYFKEIVEEYDIYLLDNTKLFGNILSSDSTPDGIHLSGQLYREWYEFIMNELENMQFYY